MKATFTKRLGAFIIDTFMLSIVFSLITMGISVDTSDINEELSGVLEQYESGEVTMEEYTDKVTQLNYELQKSNLVKNILNVVLYFGYFIVFGYLNKGQTIGKKLCKIKVVDNEGNRPSMWNMLIRSLFIYGMFTLLFSVIFVNILNIEAFTYSYVVATYVETIFMIVAFFMVLYKRDGRGLHDIMAKTNVIEEVK